MLRLNSVTLTGRAGKDALVIADGQGIKFNLAFDTGFYSQERGEWQAKPCFYPVVWFCKNAQEMAAKITTGSEICVEGRIEANNYTTKEGKEIKSHQLKAFKVHVILTKEKKNENEEYHYNGEGDLEVDDEDVPF